MAANPNRVLMSVEEYLELDRNSLDTRYEFIDGVVTMLNASILNLRYHHLGVRLSSGSES